MSYIIFPQFPKNIEEGKDFFKDIREKLPNIPWNIPELPESNPRRINANASNTISHQSNLWRQDGDKIRINVMGIDPSQLDVSINNGYLFVTVQKDDIVDITKLDSFIQFRDVKIKLDSDRKVESAAVEFGILTIKLQPVETTSTKINVSF